MRRVVYPFAAPSVPYPCGRNPCSLTFGRAALVTRRTLPWLVATVAVVLATPAPAAQFTVDSLADTLDIAVGNGSCVDADGACSLRAAIQEANALAGADSILLGPGVHALQRSGTLENLAASGDLDITSEIDLDGAGDALTRIDGSSLDRVIDVRASGLLRMQGISVTGGLQGLPNPSDPSERAGGGLLIRADGAAELDRVRIEDNRSQRDGAGISVFGSLIATRLRVLANFSNPQSGGGGGLHIGSTATLVDLDQCELQGNRATLGAGVYGDGNAVISISRCLIAGNDAGNDGGGGVAANIGSAHWLLRNVTISGNTGGGVFGDGAHQLRFEHCTITANQVNSPNGGGAISDVRGPSSPGFTAITLVNSIVSGNVQPSGNECNTVFASVIVSAGGTLRPPGNACRMSAGPGDVATTDAGLEALADNGGFSATHALSAASPAVDSAQSATCPPTDQRAQLRPQDGNNDGVPGCDIGAFERDASLFDDGFEG